MSPADLQYWIRRDPFIPFRMLLSSGDYFDVRMPDFIWIGKSRCTIGLFDDVEKDRNVDISLVHIVTIEAVPPGPNFGMHAKKIGDHA